MAGKTFLFYTLLRQKVSHSKEALPCWLAGDPKLSTMLGENVPTAVVKLCVSTGRCRRPLRYLQLSAGEEGPNFTRRLARQTFLFECTNRTNRLDDSERGSKVRTGRLQFLLVESYNMQEGSPSQRPFIKQSMLYTHM